MTDVSIPVWRRIEQAVRADILAGRYAPGGQLPPDRDLAALYGASRMTARRALAALQQDGLIRIEHGNGTFVSDDALIRYRMSGDRIRFSKDWLSAEGVELRRRILKSEEVAADDRIATCLRIEPGEPIIKLQILATADDRPISIGVRHASAARFRGLGAEFDRLGSMTAALKAFGVADYRRQSTEVTARLPTPDEAKLLAQPRIAPVLAFTATDVEIGSGAVISYFSGCFAADRVVISIGGGSGD
jgi:GntR family phosphonate transport system transcriptional regulator